MKIVSLRKEHDRKGFDCGEEALNRWFERSARQHNDRFLSRTYAAVEHEASSEVLGFYALTTAELDRSSIDHESLSHLPVRVPAYRLGRLAVSVNHRGMQYGKIMALDALAKAESVTEKVGGVLLLVDAKVTAVDFYVKLGYVQFNGHPTKLFYPLNKR